MSKARPERKQYAAATAAAATDKHSHTYCGIAIVSIASFVLGLIRRFLAASSYGLLVFMCGAFGRRGAPSASFCARAMNARVYGEFIETLPRSNQRIYLLNKMNTSRGLLHNDNSKRVYSRSGVFLPSSLMRNKCFKIG